ncbi:hypothetical protein GIB67_034178 [Kingdonia uniflora]|uniref:Uncharacterized protein n=1 Tax=Kingdonia uniflora TaxID=39325 RepID=A0A7J7NRI1_9MAGN|nr:hypothetical protein GIB67_034178 [Kingdonia uniflora]
MYAFEFLCLPIGWFLLPRRAAAVRGSRGNSYGSVVAALVADLFQSLPPLLLLFYSVERGYFSRIKSPTNRHPFPIAAALFLCWADFGVVFDWWIVFGGGLLGLFRRGLPKPAIVAISVQMFASPSC